MKDTIAVLTAAAVFLTGCSSERPKPSPKADDVNKQHTKGTTDVLRNYRYGEPAPGSKRSK